MQVDCYEHPLSRGTPINTADAVAAIKSASARYPRFDDRFISDIINCSWGIGGQPDPVLRDAVNYAFQHGVSFVASSGNQYSSVIAYPASFDNEWVTKVGASNKRRARTHYSNYGNKLDLIAPGGGCPNGFGQNDPINDDDIVYATRTSEYGQQPSRFDCFDGTSAAAPHVSGLMALLRSEALDRGWNDLEPEDYEGMIKASAFDLRDEDDEFGGSYDNRDEGLYSDYYDERTGWGHLQSDRIFDMLERGYRISHYNIESGFIKVAMDVSPIVPEYIDNGNPLNKYWTFSGFYETIRYYCTNIITLPGGKWYIDDDNPLFVWGRSGRAAKSGISLANPAYFSGYTRVTSGTGGNGIVDGIFHSQSLDVNITTFQNVITQLDFPGLSRYIPPNDELGANISVFGLEIPTSVFNNEIINKNFYASAYPIPAQDKINVQIILKEPSGIIVEIVDYLGNIIIEENNNKLFSGIETLEFDVSNFNNGLYFLRLKTINSMGILKFLKGGN